MHADTLWHNWSGLDEVMKTGRPFQAAHDHEAFIMGMHNLASLRVKEVLKHIDLRGAKNALDLGSGPGTYAIGMAKKGIAVTLFDRPETLAIAQKLIKQAKVKGVSFIEGDFLFDDIGKGYDLVFISQILHALSAEQNKFLLAKSMQSLNSGGTAVIQEFYIDRSRTSPPQSALFSINMLVNTEAGRCYAPSEIKQWLSEAGFSSVKHKIFDDHVLVTGRKI
jgi:ubiquinone/menaquinone biosynthesis C-methylase UbiE